MILATQDRSATVSRHVDHPNLPRPVHSFNPFPFMRFRTLYPQWSISNSFGINHFRTLSHPTEGVPSLSGPHESPVTIHESLSPLECALTSKHRVLPGFGRSCPPASPLESALTKTVSANPLECALTKKVGGGGSRPFQFSNFNFQGCMIGRRGSIACQTSEISRRPN